MTPLEIFEYKQSWRDDAYRVAVHSDYKMRIEDWIKNQCEVHEWNWEYYTDHYEHTYLFHDNDKALKLIEFYNLLQEDIDE